MRIVKYLLLASLIAVFATPALAVEIGGFVDIGLFDVEGNGTVTPANGPNAGVRCGMIGADPSTAGAMRNGANDAGNTTFAINWVRIALTEDLTDNISVTVHLDSNNSAAVTVTKAYVDFVNPGPADITLRVGEHMSILGLEPRTSTSPSRDAISMTMLSNWTVGTQSGVAILGSFAPLNYAFSVVNDAYGGVEDRNGADAVSGNDDNQMTFAGNIGVVPIEGLELGVFAEFGANANTNEAVNTFTNNNSPGVTGNDSDHELWGVYGEYAYGPFKVNGEYIKDDEELSTQVLGVDDNSVEAWYIYGSYDVTSELTLWLRYGEAEYEGEILAGTAGNGNANATAFSNEQIPDQERFAFGASYAIADNVTVKVEYQDNDEEDVNANNNIAAIVGADVDNDVLAGSLVVSF